MDIICLKKKLSTYESDKGYLKNVGEEVLYEVLVNWEEWTGTAKEFYRSLGFSQKQMASLIGKAKKLKREGYFGNEHFKELVVASDANVPESISRSAAGSMIELDCKNGKVIRFPRVDQLLEYLKKAS